MCARLDSLGDLDDAAAQVETVEAVENGLLGSRHRYRTVFGSERRDAPEARRLYVDNAYLKFPDGRGYRFSWCRRLDDHRGGKLLGEVVVAEGCPIRKRGRLSHVQRFHEIERVGTTHDVQRVDAASQAGCPATLNPPAGFHPDARVLPLADSSYIIHTEHGWEPCQYLTCRHVLV